MQKKGGKSIPETGTCIVRDLFFLKKMQRKISLLQKCTRNPFQKLMQHLFNFETVHNHLSTNVNILRRPASDVTQADDVTRCFLPHHLFLRRTYNFLFHPTQALRGHYPYHPVGKHQEDGNS
uniref:Uncharacterized protein n=1 Tax=Cacopsylla melanoneura TaxID=428564 RepID=A0A8D8XE56_9HEMI